MTNLPAPTEQQVSALPFPPACLEEVIRLYGLRQWVEQSYTQVKHALGWSQYQVRSDSDPTALAIGVLCLLVLLASLNGLNKDTLWRSTVLLDPSSTKYRYRTSATDWSLCRAC